MFATPAAAQANALAVSPDAKIVIGEEFGHEHFEGATFLFTAEHSCLEANFQVRWMPTGWDNRVRSAKSICSYATHFENEEFGGAYINCGEIAGRCGTMGAMAAQTSSVKWHD